MLSPDETAHCIFEHVYFARPDSKVFQRSVHSSRYEMGQQLAREHPADADLVVPVPDSGVTAALGFSNATEIPFQFGLIRNHYVGRTFIEPKKSIRHFGVKVKLNPVRQLLEGRRVVIVDDSIVRGTTSKKIVEMLRQAGATEVHMRIASPPTVSPCHYGINTPTYSELIANRMSVQEIRKYIQADTLAFLSVEGMKVAVGAEEGFWCCMLRSEVPDPTHATGPSERALRDGRRLAYLLAVRGESRVSEESQSSKEAGPQSGLTYADAGVDIDRADQTKQRIKDLARSTFTAEVAGDIGLFGALFRPDFSRLQIPVLVSSVDGVGTKLKIAFMTGIHNTVGVDIVSHCVNDILVQGALPLFFMDYIAAGRLEPNVIEEVVSGLAAACRESRCALLGGETAEMPDFYSDGEYDLAGFVVGVGDQSKLLGADRVEPR